MIYLFDCVLTLYFLEQVDLMPNTVTFQFTPRQITLVETFLYREIICSRIATLTGFEELDKALFMYYFGSVETSSLQYKHSLT